MKNVMDTIKKRKEFGILFMIIALSVLVTVVNPTFLTLNNIFNFLRSNAVYGIMAFGMLPVLISGGIDLSISSTIALCAVIDAHFMLANPGSNVLIVMIISMLVGGIVGLLNGVLITQFKIPPIVATLGVQTITLASVLLYTGGIWISGLPEWFINFGRFQLGSFESAGYVVGLSIQAIIMILAGVVTFIILKYTLLGRGIYAVGGNQQSAVRVGYNVNRTLMFIYAYSGLMTGLAAVAHVGITGQVDPNTYLDYEMDVIAVVVLGGASLAGGFGTILGTSFGIILMAIIKNGLVLTKVSGYWQKAIMGLIILVTVCVDAINYKRQQENLVKVDVEE